MKRFIETLIDKLRPVCVDNGGTWSSDRSSAFTAKKLLVYVLNLFHRSVGSQFWRWLGRR